MGSKFDHNVINSLENVSSYLDMKFSKSCLDLGVDSDDDSEECVVLWELVRSRYMKRLNQTLLDNLDVTKGYQKQHLNKIDEAVDLCMVQMEKRALRDCMVARIYREEMTKMVCYFLTVYQWRR